MHRQRAHNNRPATSESRSANAGTTTIPAIAGLRHNISIHRWLFEKKYDNKNTADLNAPEKSIDVTVKMRFVLIIVIDFNNDCVSLNCGFHMFLTYLCLRAYVIHLFKKCVEIF